MSVSHWPDASLNVLSKIKLDVPLSELLLWLNIRDMLLGENCVKQDVGSAFALSRGCKHPNALWLTSLLENASLDVESVFLSSEDPQAKVFVSLLQRRNGIPNYSPVIAASNRGDPFCQAFVARVCSGSGEEAMRLAKLSSDKGERDGLFFLGWIYDNGFGCRRSVEKAIHFYRLAAALQHIMAMVNLGWLLPESDPQRWFCWAKHQVVLKGETTPFFHFFQGVLSSFFAGDQSLRSSAFAIGCALFDHVDDSTIFGVPCDTNFISSAKRGVDFYRSQCRLARLAIMAWTQAGVRLGVVKDVRKMIGRMIWERRVDADYENVI